MRLTTWLLVWWFAIAAGGLGGGQPYQIGPFRSYEACKGVRDSWAAKHYGGRNISDCWSDGR